MTSSHLDKAMPDMSHIRRWLQLHPNLSPKVELQECIIQSLNLIPIRIRRKHDRPDYRREYLDPLRAVLYDNYSPRISHIIGVELVGHLEDACRHCPQCHLLKQLVSSGDVCDHMTFLSQSLLEMLTRAIEEEIIRGQRKAEEGRFSADHFFAEL